MAAGEEMRRIFEQKCTSFIKEDFIVCSLLLAVLICLIKKFYKCGPRGEGVASRKRDQIYDRIT
jgi:hypothetical protein